MLVYVFGVLNTLKFVSIMSMIVCLCMTGKTDSYFTIVPKKEDMIEDE